MSPDAWTAIGAIALAVTTLAAVATTIVITAQDRRRADAQLAAERERLEEERHRARGEEQLAEAWSVGAEMRHSGTWDNDGVQSESLYADVVNRGRFTITRLETRFCLDGSAIARTAESERAAFSDQAGTMIYGMHDEDVAMTGVLRGWGESIRFTSETLPVEQLKDPYALVRWTDRWGTRWEHRLGVVRKIGADDGWRA